MLTYQHKLGPVFETVMVGRKVTHVTVEDLITAIFRKDSHQVSAVNQRSEDICKLFGIRDQQEKISSIIHSIIFPRLVEYLRLADLDSITKDCAAHTRKDLSSGLEVDINGRCKLSLWKLIQTYLYSLGCKALFGYDFPVDQTRNPYGVFNAGAPHVLVGLPFLGREAIQAREALVKIIIDFHGRLEDANFEGSSSFLANCVETMRSSDITEDNIARTTALMLFGSQTNSMQVAFWMVAFVIGQPACYQRLQNEVVEFIRAQYGGNPDRLKASDMTSSVKLPLLESCFWETLRLCSMDAVSREASEDFELGVAGTNSQVFRIHRGETLSPSLITQHYNVELFNCPEEFRGDRFIDDNCQPRRVNLEGRTRLLSDYVIGFGGGKFMCKGRNLAKVEVKLFIALLLTIFDVIFEKTGDGCSVGYARPQFKFTGMGTFHAQHDILLNLKLRHMEG